jgi:SAM-dependent methyltransferase
MLVNFPRIAYAALPVCNALELDDVEAAVARTGLSSDARMLDLGCAHAGVSLALARRFGFQADAVDADGAMVDLARERIEASGLKDRVRLHHAWSGPFLRDQPAYDLIIAIGVIDPVGDGALAPEAMLHGLSHHLAAGGWLLWGDLVWKAEPPEPLRRVIEANNLYADHSGWQSAARAAGLEVVTTGLSSDETWTRYMTAMETSVTTWAAAHPDRPETPGIAARGDRLRARLSGLRPLPAAQAGLRPLHPHRNGGSSKARSLRECSFEPSSRIKSTAWMPI